MNYSIHSPYPIQSVFPLSDSHFATILPLDNLLQIYSTTSSHPLASLWCSGSIFIDSKINNYYLTHGLYSISLFSDSSHQTIDVEDQIQSNLIKMGDRHVNLGGNGKLHYYDIKDCINKTQERGVEELDERRARERGKQIPFVKLSESDSLISFSSKNNEYIIYNTQYQYTVKTSTTPDKIQSLIPYQNMLIINSSNNVFFHDTRVNKLVNKIKLQQSTSCVKVLKDEEIVYISGKNKLLYFDVRMGKETKSMEIPLPKWKKIKEFELIGDGWVTCFVEQPYSLDICAV